MSNLKNALVVSVYALAVTVGVQNVTFAADAKAPQKYAVVDVKKVVNHSQSVKDLKAQREKQKETVAKFIKDGNAQVDAETDPVKKEALKKKLNNDLRYMTKTYDKRYQDGLADVNKEITTGISEVAKEKKYELILTTDAVLYGGQNITNEIIKAVK